MKRKSKDEAFAPTLSSLHDVETQSDILLHISSYWSGKDLSTYLVAVSASKVMCSHKTSTIPSLIKCIGKRCLHFLDGVNAPDTMKSLVSERMDGAINHFFSLQKQYMKLVSEWCALIDYCELTPLRLSEARLKQDKPIKPLWVVGAGVFQAPPLDNEPSLGTV